MILGAENNFFRRFICGLLICGMNAQAFALCLENLKAIVADKTTVSGLEGRDTHFGAIPDKNRWQVMREENPFRGYPSPQTADPKTTFNPVTAASTFAEQHLAIAEAWRTKAKKRPWSGRLQESGIQKLAAEIGGLVENFIVENRVLNGETLGAYIGRIHEHIVAKDAKYQNPDATKIINNQIARYFFEWSDHPEVMWQLALAEIGQYLPKISIYLGDRPSATTIFALNKEQYLDNMVGQDRHSNGHHQEESYIFYTFASAAHKAAASELNPYCGHKSKRSGGWNEFSTEIPSEPFHRVAGVRKFHEVFPGLRAAVSAKSASTKPGLERDIVNFILTSEPLQGESLGQYMQRAHRSVFAIGNFALESDGNMFMKKHILNEAPDPKLMWQLVLAETWEHSAADEIVPPEVIRIYLQPQPRVVRSDPPPAAPRAEEPPPAPASHPPREAEPAEPAFSLNINPPNPHLQVTSTVLIPVISALAAFSLGMFALSYQDHSDDRKNKASFDEWYKRKQEIIKQKFAQKLQSLEGKVLEAIKSIEANRADAATKISEMNIALGMLKQELLQIDSKQTGAVAKVQQQLEDQVKNFDGQLHELRTSGAARFDELKTEITSVKKAAAVKETELALQLANLSADITFVSKLAGATALQRIALGWIKESRPADAHILSDLLLEHYLKEFNREHAGESKFDKSDAKALIKANAEGLTATLPLGEFKAKLEANNLSASHREKFIRKTEVSNPLDFFRESASDSYGSAIAFLLVNLEIQDAATLSEQRLVNVFKGDRDFTGRMIPESTAAGQTRFKLVVIDHAADGAAEVEVGYVDQLGASGEKIKVMDLYDWGLIQGIASFGADKDLDVRWKQLIEAYWAGSVQKTAEKFGIK